MIILRLRLRDCAPWSVILGSIVLQALAASPCAAQEWTRFRGPGGGGIGQGAIPASWTEKDYAWKVAVPGRGHSSPVLWGNRLFLVSADEKTGHRTVHCFDADSGKELWSRPFEAAKHRKHQKNSFATSTPVVDADHVYVAWAVPEMLLMMALDHEGKTVWRADLGGFKGGHGFGTSPIVFEDMVILGNDQDGESSLLALESKTGKVRWTSPRRSLRTTYSTPCVYQPKGRDAELIFTNWQHGITSINPRDGSVNWETAVFGKDKERAIGSPVIAGDLVIGTCGFVTADKHVVAIRPYPPANANGGGKNNAETTAAEVYRIERAAPHIPTVLFKDGLLYLWSDQGIVTCVAADTGERIWQKRIGGNYSASPVYASGRIYNVSEEGEAVVLAAGREFRELGRVDLGGACYSTPAIARGKMYFRTAGFLLAIGAVGR